MSEPDEYGVALNWVDSGGAHRVRLRFGRRLCSPVELITEMQRFLDDQDGATAPTD